MTRPAAILVRGLTFVGRHGATASERRKEQPFTVDLELTIDAARAAASDRLTDTVDYDAVCELVCAIGTQKSFHLLEALAATMVDAIGERWPKVGVALEVRKLHPPSPGSPEYTAVRMKR